MANLLFGKGIVNIISEPRLSKLIMFFWHDSAGSTGAAERETSRSSFNGDLGRGLHRWLFGHTGNVPDMEVCPISFYLSF